MVGSAFNEITNQSGFTIYNVTVNKLFTLEDYVIQKGKAGKINYKTELYSTAPASVNVSNFAFIFIPTNSSFNSSKPKLTLSETGLSIYFTPGKETVVRSISASSIPNVTINVAANALNGTYLIALEPGACPPLIGTFLLTIGDKPSSNFSTPIPS